MSEDDKQTKYRLDTCGLGARFKDKTFDNFEVCKGHESEMQPVFDACKAYADNFEQNKAEGKWLVLIGPCGTGKGHLAAAIATQIIREYDQWVKFKKYIELVSSIKNTWGGRTEDTEQEIITEACKCDLLIMDEIGVQFDTNAERVLIYRVLDSRYENLKPLIMTTNLCEKEIGKVVGQRILDRMCEPPNEIIILNWPSYRQRGGR